VEDFREEISQIYVKINKIILQEINLGIIYKVIWDRDVSYILTDWVLSCNVDGRIQQIYHLWTHQYYQLNITKWNREYLNGKGSINTNEFL
jgi:hypothetical protein